MKTGQVIRVCDYRLHHHDPQQEQQSGGIPRAACRTQK